MSKFVQWLAVHVGRGGKAPDARALGEKVKRTWTAVQFRAMRRGKGEGTIEFLQKQSKKPVQPQTASRPLRRPLLTPRANGQ